MAYGGTHAQFDNHVFALWDEEKKTGRILKLNRGEAIEPHMGLNTIIIFAGRDDEGCTEAERQITRWRAAHGLHLRLVTT